MKRVAISILFVSLSFPGCLSERKETKENQKLSLLDGFVWIGDYNGAIVQGGNQAALEASFIGAGEASANKARRAMVNEIIERRDSGVRATECRIVKTPITATTPAPAAPEYLSMGQMGLFTPGGGISYIDETATHEYSRNLPGPLVAGDYQVAVAGTKKNRGFKLPAVKLAEIFGNPKANNSPMMTEPVGIRKNDPLVMEWTASTSQAQNVVYLEVSTANETEKTRLVCDALESEISVSGGVARWEIPVEYVSQLDPTPKGLIFIHRLDGFAIKDPSVGEIKVRADRFTATQALVSE